MKRLFQSNLLTVFLSFLAAMMVSVAVYPEIFISFKATFKLWSDYCIDYPLTFVLTNFFYQGGLQLWNYFGQMPFFHTYAAEGLFKLPNVVTAIIYCILEPFTDDSSRLFHQAFTWGYLMTLLLVRITGIFLLLKTVTRNRIILTAGTVVFAVFFSQMAFLRGAFYMSCFPLGIYFVVRFFEGLQRRYLIALILFLVISLGSGILHGAYLYLPMHFFIISGILWKTFFNRTPKRLDSFLKSWSWKDMRWVILIVALILVPYGYILKFGFPDLAFGQADSRISHPFSPYWYFHNPVMELGNPSSFFSVLLNMQTFDMFYIGISFLFLALAGLILSRNALKYFFGMAIFFLWLLSFPRESFNIGFIAHWINVLTNPLKTFPRSYMDASQAVLPYLLMPLVVLGIESIQELYKGKKYPSFALGLLGMMTILLVLNGFTVLRPEANAYLITGAVLLCGGLLWLHLKNSSSARNFLVGTLCLLAVIDVFFIIYQSKNRFVHLYTRKPAIFDASPQAGIVEYDFENPSIFPFRYSYTLHFSYKDQTYLWSPHGVSSAMHHVINQGLNFVYLNGYTPRHTEFAKWLNDPEMLPYLSQNDEFIFLAQSAINASPDALSRICSAGLAKQVIEVDDPQGSLGLPDQWPSSVTKKKGDAIYYSQFTGTLDGDNVGSEYQAQGDLIVFTLQLPSGFPEHLTSSIFPSEQRYLRFFVEGTAGQQWQELQAAEGELIRPNTFDVQNIKSGELKVAFSKNDFPMKKRCVLLYPSSENQGVEGLWRKQFDNLGIIYRAKTDGWFVGHFPYDPKWRISLDGKPVAYYRVDKSFIGFPLGPGEHKILIQYWPHSPLRALLLISALLTTIGLLVEIFLALRWEEE